MMTNSKKLKVYLAGGWFNESQDKVLTFLEEILFKRKNLEIYSPRRQAQIEPGTINKKEVRQKVFNSNLKAIEDCDVVIASTEGKDMGTIWECGYAYKLNKPIFYVYFTKNPLGFNLMLSESGKGVILNEKDFKDFAKLLDWEGLDLDCSYFEYDSIIE